MAKLRSRDLFGSLVAGLSKGVSAYSRGKYVEGQQGLKSAEKKAKEREAEEKALAKRRQEAEDQSAFLKARDDEFSQYAAGELKRMNLGRKLDNSEMKRLFEDFDERQAAEAGENEQFYEAMQETGVDRGEPAGSFFGSFLEEEDLAPADMGTVGGRKRIMPYIHETRDMIDPIERILGAVGMSDKDPLPLLDLERVFTGAQYRAAKRKDREALEGAEREKLVKRIVDPEKTPGEKGRIKAGTYAAEQEELERLGYGPEGKGEFAARRHAAKMETLEVLGWGEKVLTPQEKGIEKAQTEAAYKAEGKRLDLFPTEDAVAQSKALTQYLTEKYYTDLAGPKPKKPTRGDWADRAKFARQDIINLADGEFQKLPDDIKTVLEIDQIRTEHDLRKLYNRANKYKKSSNFLKAITQSMVGSRRLSEDEMATVRNIVAFGREIAKINTSGWRKQWEAIPVVTADQNEWGRSYYGPDWDDRSRADKLELIGADYRGQ